MSLVTKPGSLWQNGLPTLTAGLTPATVVSSGSCGAHGAVVLDRLAGVDAALELQAAAEPRADVEQHPVVALVLLAEVARRA